MLSLVMKLQGCCLYSGGDVDGTIMGFVKQIQILVLSRPSLVSLDDTFHLPAAHVCYFVNRMLHFL